MVTRKDVAKLAGVSVATVSNVFSEKNIVAPLKASAVREAAKKLKYIPNHTARSLSLGRTMHMGVSINEYTNPYHMEIIKGIEKYATNQGYVVSIFLINSKPEQKISFMETLQLDALINMTTNNYPLDFVNILNSRGTVLADFGDQLGPTFGCDYSEALKSIFKKIAEFGHKKVGYVSTIDKYRFAVDPRSSFYLNNREKYGFEISDDLIVCNEDLLSTSEDAGYNCAKTLLKKRSDITTIIATNDLSALGVMRAVHEMGLSVPQDISVIGCDDINISKLLVPSLTTIKYDKKEFGKYIAKTVIDLIETKQSGIGLRYVVSAVEVLRGSLSFCKNNKL